MENVIITNQGEFEDRKAQMKKNGVLALHILADFDNTFTKITFNGQRIRSLMGVLRESNIMPESYNQKVYELFNYYRPFEAREDIDKIDKKKIMTEWWNRGF